MSGLISAGIRSRTLASVAAALYATTSTPILFFSTETSTLHLLQASPHPGASISIESREGKVSGQIEGANDRSLPTRDWRARPAGPATSIGSRAVPWLGQRRSTTHHLLQSRS